MRLQGFPGAAVVAGAGLFLALTAPPGRVARTRGHAVLPAHVEVPDSLLLASGAAFALSVAIVIGMALSRDRRRREVELPREEEPSKLPWWLQVCLRVLPLLPLLAILAVFSLGVAVRRDLAARWSRS